MRETKFRAWIDDSKRLEHVERIDFLNKLILFCGKSTWNDYEYEDIIIEQFTGLHDKNGVEIYENDKIFDGKYNGIIEYRECSFIVNWEIHCPHDEDLNYWNDKILVIGNIHERSKQDEENK